MPTQAKPLELEVGVAAKLGRAVQHAGLAAHEQGAHSLPPSPVLDAAAAVSIR